MSLFRNCMIVAVTTAASLTSTASYAVECDSPRLTRAFNTGVAAGGRLVNRAWARVNDCNRVDYFEGIVLDNLQRL